MNKSANQIGFTFGGSEGIPMDISSGKSVFVIQNCFSTQQILICRFDIVFSIFTFVLPTIL